MAKFPDDLGGDPEKNILFNIVIARRLGYRFGTMNGRFCIINPNGLSVGELSASYNTLVPAIAEEIAWREYPLRFTTSFPFAVGLPFPKYRLVIIQGEGEWIISFVDKVADAADPLLTTRVKSPADIALGICRLYWYTSSLQLEREFDDAAQMNPKGL